MRFAFWQGKSSFVVYFVKVSHVFFDNPKQWNPVEEGKKGKKKKNNNPVALAIARLF